MCGEDGQMTCRRYKDETHIVSAVKMMWPGRGVQRWEGKKEEELSVRVRGKQP